MGNKKTQTNKIKEGKQFAYSELMRQVTELNAQETYVRERKQYCAKQIKECIIQLNTLIDRAESMCLEVTLEAETRSHAIKPEYRPSGKYSVKISHTEMY